MVDQQLHCFLELWSWNLDGPKVQALTQVYAEMRRKMTLRSVAILLMGKVPRMDEETGWVLWETLAMRHLRSIAQHDDALVLMVMPEGDCWCHRRRQSVRKRTFPRRSSRRASGRSRQKSTLYTPSKLGLGVLQAPSVTLDCFRPPWECHPGISVK